MLHSIPLKKDWIKLLNGIQPIWPKTALAHTAMIKPSYVLLLIPFSTLCLSHPVQARLNTLTGGITTGLDYNETDYSKDSNDDTSNEIIPPKNSYLKKLSIGPLFILETTSTIDQLTIRYNPSYTYDLENSHSDIDHDFSLSGYRNFSKNLRFSLRDSFIYSDDPNLIESDNGTDYNRGRRRYWTNNFNINSTYTYATANNSFGGGYSYNILRNEDTGPGGYEDYDKHVADLSLQHHINASWNITATTSYTRGLFDPPNQELAEDIGEGLESLSPGITEGTDTKDLSNDLSVYRAGGTLNWILSQRKTFSASYDFSGSVYDAILRNDTNLHNLTLGAQYQYSTRLSFALGGGPSYEKTETFDGNWDYNGYFNLNYKVSKRSELTASVEKGYDQENFSSNNNALGRDQGLTEFWEWKLAFSHELFKDLNTNLFVSYRDEHQEDILHGVITGLESDTALQTTDSETFREENIFNRINYRAGGSLSYTFLQWWTTALNYTYNKQDSERINDSYDEHRLYLTLTVQKELLRW
jgi:hypothetical protein